MRFTEEKDKYYLKTKKQRIKGIKNQRKAKGIKL